MKVIALLRKGYENMPFSSDKYWWGHTTASVCVCESVHMQLWSPRCTEKPQCDLLFPSSDGISQLKATHTHTDTQSQTSGYFLCQGGHYKATLCSLWASIFPHHWIILCVWCACGVRVCACTCVMRRAYSICWEKERLRYTCTLRVLVWCVSETQISTDQTDETETNKPSAQAAASIFDLDCTDLSSQSSFSGLYSPLLGQTILGTT